MSAKSILASVALAAALSFPCLVCAEPRSDSPQASEPDVPGPRPSGPQASAEYLYGLPEGTDLARLVDRPTLVGTTNYLFDDPETGERRLGGYAEVVAVYDVPIDELVAVTTDYESYPSFMPRIFGVRTIREAGDEALLEFKAGIRFLGVDVAFVSTFEYAVDRRPDGGVGIRSRLVESEDQSEFEHFTSFYFLPVVVRGREMTFVRYFNRPGIRRPSPGLLQVLGIIISPESKAQLRAIAKEASARRAGRIGAASP
ncbi:MAG: SRPBCC family protein [Spirochaetes bacterium]|nr:SRPBCC family protein [Spirochaetota bacterium]MBU1081279.1 SRPBCC family protein [Spirochaetota bacterium]